MFKKMSAVVYFRNFVFGVEDSLVSTVGLLSGIALASVPRETILLTGVVLIFTEAFSMAAGSFLSESSAEEYTTGSDQYSKRSFLAGGVMFFSYLLSGFIPLAAYAFWPVSTALPFSILFSLTALFILGVVGAKVSGASILKDSIRMVMVGGMAIAMGSLAGVLLSYVTLV